MTTSSILRDAGTPVAEYGPIRTGRGDDIVDIAGDRLATQRGLDGWRLLQRQMLVRDLAVGDAPPLFAESWLKD